MRILVIGAGSMGRRRVRALKSLGYKEISMYDIKYPENIAENGVFFVSQNLAPEDVFKHGKYDAVIISTPPLTKQKYIDLSNQYGIKPFAEADVILYSGVYCPSATMRHNLAVQKIKELIDIGEIGEIRTFTHHCGNHIEDWHPGTDKKTYYAMSKEAGGCKEIFPFELSWLSYIFGTPINCIGMVDKKLNDVDIKADDIYSVAVKFKGDDYFTVTFPEGKINVYSVNKSKWESKNYVTGTILIDIVSRPAIRELRIVGSKANLLWNWDNDYIEIEYPDGEISLVFYPKGNAHDGYNKNIDESMYVAEIKNFLDAVQGKCEYLYPKADEEACINALRKVEGNDRILY